MAALRTDFFGSLRDLFGAKPQDAPDSKKARAFSNRVYKEMGGPTPQMRRFYAELLENERRSKADG